MIEKNKLILSGKVLTGQNNADKAALFIYPGLLFLISFIYFFWFGNSIFFLQEKRTLFIFSQDYLHDFINKPGGLLEYAGNFITQGYFSKGYASLVISLSLLLFYALFIRINRLLSGDNSFSLLLSIIPACLLLLSQVREDHFMHYTLGFLLIAGFYPVTIMSVKRRLNYIVPVLFPLFFYLTGSFALLFLLIYIVYCLAFIKGFQKYLLSLIIIAIAFVTLISFKEILFLQPTNLLLRYPINISDMNNLAGGKTILSAYIVLFPVILKIKGNLKIKPRFSLLVPLLSLIVVFSVTLYFLTAHYDSRRKNDLRLEEFFCKQDWDELIEQYEKLPSNSLISQYYYNLALTEKGQLCDRMFSGHQDHGINSLVLPRKREFISRSIYFYYAIGLINEAHHLAYESMVLDGYRAENLKMLVKTDIINGYYKNAEQNINILKKTLHYRHWAVQFEKMLYKPEIVYSDPELGDKIKLMPVTDFFIGPDNIENIDLVLIANPDNKKAFEYKMAFLLLEKDYRAIMYQVKRLKDMKYASIPRHIEESMMIFISSKDELPYLGDFIISHETENSYRIFVNDLRINKTENRSELERSMKNKWGNTFWFYYEFN